MSNDTVLVVFRRKIVPSADESDSPEEKQGTLDTKTEEKKTEETDDEKIHLFGVFRDPYLLAVTTKDDESYHKITFSLQLPTDRNLYFSSMRHCLDCCPVDDTKSLYVIERKHGTDWHFEAALAKSPLTLPEELPLTRGYCISLPFPKDLILQEVRALKSNKENNKIKKELLRKMHDEIVKEDLAKLKKKMSKIQAGVISMPYLFAITIVVCLVLRLAVT